MIMGPEEDLVSVGKQTAFFNMTNKVSDGNIIHNKFKIILVLNGFFKLLHIFGFKWKSAQVYVFQILSKF